jgi:uncharacterized membrane protein
MVVLSYLWILCIIPLVAEKDDAEVQWHAKNGLALTLAEILLHAGVWVLEMVLSRIASGIGCVLGLVGAFLWLGGLVLRILCIMKAVNGQRFVIPVVSDYVNRF